jgi:hypothetical protein
MPNRSQEENEAIILDVLRKAGEIGLDVDQIRRALFGDGEQSKSLTKKLLERLKTRGHIRVKMGRLGPMYLITPGH